MALSRQDREIIASTVTLSIKTAMEPIQQSFEKMDNRLQTVEDTMFGPKGDNGIYRAVKKNENEISKLKKIYSAVGGIVTAIVVLKDDIIGFLSGNPPTQ